MKYFYRGFTLIELLLVLSIMGIFISLAYPSFREIIQRNHRIDASSSLLKLQYLQENYRVLNEAYASLDALKIGNQSENDYYRIELNTPPDGSEYLATATPINSQVGDSCGIFALNQFGAVYQGFASEKCWQQ